jgi:hypothetical protein
MAVFGSPSLFVCLGWSKGMSVDTDFNFVTLSSGLVVNIAYWERGISARYEIWLRRNTIDEWIDNGCKENARVSLD